MEAFFKQEVFGNEGWKALTVELISKVYQLSCKNYSCGDLYETEIILRVAVPANQRTSRLG